MPRGETEAWTSRLVELLLKKSENVQERSELGHYGGEGGDGRAVEDGGTGGETGNGSGKSKKRGLKILDLCSGSGCISLSLYAGLYRRFPGLEVMAVDNNPLAEELAERTARLNVKLGRLPASLMRKKDWRNYGEGGLAYLLTDILSAEAMNDLLQSRMEEVDVLVANPPYISRAAFDRDTSRSARIWEPRGALVPLSLSSSRSEDGMEKREETGDVFYRPILDVAVRYGAKVVVMEVADEEQADRVLRNVQEKDVRADKADAFWERCQVWHDELSVRRDPEGSAHRISEGLTGVPVERVGSGNARAVVLGRGWGAEVLNG